MLDKGYLAEYKLTLTTVAADKKDDDGTAKDADTTGNEEANPSIIHEMMNGKRNDAGKDGYADDIQINIL